MFGNHSFILFLAYFSAHYTAVFCAQLCCSGIGYAISTIFNPKSSQMASVVVVLVMAMVSGQHLMCTVFVIACMEIIVDQNIQYISVNGI
jgi:hypothetical protein